MNTAANELPSKLQSMTGFARISERFGNAAITWELKSVNGKTLETRLRLPPGFDRLDLPTRRILQGRFARGNVQGLLTISREQSQTLPTVNEAILNSLALHAKRIEAEFHTAPATSAQLLALRGVIDISEFSDAEETRLELDSAILCLAEKATDALAVNRSGEGRELGKVLSQQIDQIEVLTLRANSDPSRNLAVIKARLAEQVRTLLEGNVVLDEGRLAMEAALLATKADIREELDRLTTHIAAARELLKAGGSIGRRLDFLAQEFNRESNTLCSKSNAASVTSIGLELKVVVDQFREQIQNLE